MFTGRRSKVHGLFNRAGPGSGSDPTPTGRQARLTRECALPLLRTVMASPEDGADAQVSWP